MFVDRIKYFFAKGNGDHIYNNQYPDEYFFISQYDIDLKLHYKLWEIVEKKSNDEIIIRCKSIWDKPERIFIAKRQGEKAFEIEYIK